MRLFSRRPKAPAAPPEGAADQTVPLVPEPTEQPVEPVEPVAEGAVEADARPTKAMFEPMLETFRDNGNVVVRAELPNIDPDKEIELTVVDGMLHISAHHSEEDTNEVDGYVCREFRYASFSRTLPLPDGVSETEIRATYNDGVLEIRLPAPNNGPVRKVEITKG